ncbi:hypothetical protein BZG06_11090 [Salinivibrio kushneri]|nr:hypothetical protein BZG06_11090 [Salinivibrio kushneri]
MKEMKKGVTSMLLAIIQDVQGRVGTSRKPKAVPIASMPAHLQNDIGVDIMCVPRRVAFYKRAASVAVTAWVAGCEKRG